MGIFDRVRSGQRVSPFAGSSSGGGGSGTVTSVALSVPSFLSVSGSPVTTSGTIAVSLNGFTTGSIPFVSGGNTFAQDNANLFWDNTNKSLLIGTTSQPAGVTGTPFYFVGTNASSANSFGYVEYVASNSGANGFAIRHARGTTAARTNVLNGDSLGGITFNGYTAAGYGAGTAGIFATAGEDFNNTTTANRGSTLIFQTTPTGASGTRRNSFFVGPGNFRFYDVNGSNNINMVVPTGANYSMTLPSAVPGTSTTFLSMGTGGTLSNVSFSGDVSASSPGVISVDKIKTTAVSATAPTANQTLLYSVGSLSWVPTTLGGDISPQITQGFFNVDKIKGTAVSATGPTTGQVLTYDGTQWAPATPSGGGSVAGADSQIQYNGSGAFAATANFTWDNSSKALNLTGGTGKSLSATSTTAATYLEFDSTNGVQFVMGADGPNSQSFFGSQSNHQITFRTNNVNRMSLSNTGTLTMAGTNAISFGGDGTISGNGGGGRININAGVIQFGGGLQWLTSPIQIYIPSQDSDIRSTTNLRLAPNLAANQNVGNVALGNAHLAFYSQNGTSSVPTTTVNANAGTGATSTLSSGQRDAVGQVTLITGSAAWAAGAQLDVTFQGAYTNAPKVIITPGNAAAASAWAALAVQPYVTASTTAFTINFVNADLAANTYIWNYFVVSHI